MGHWGSGPLELGHVEKFGSFYVHVYYLLLDSNDGQW